MADDEDVGALYDALGPLYDGEYAAETADIAFFQALAARCGGPVLELACGSARVLCELADPERTPLVGLDASKVLLARGEKRLAAHPVAAPLFEREEMRLCHGDMRSFEVAPGGFALIFVALNGLLHLTGDGDQARCLACAARHLKKGGLLALDVFNPENKDTHPGVHGLDLSGDFVDPDTGERVLRLANVCTDYARQRRRYVHLYDAVGADGAVKRRVHEFTLRYVYKNEMELLLAGAGLALEGVYGGYGFEPYTGREDLMLFVAEKR
jgi:SAM-dependent methyltransferase